MPATFFVSTGAVGAGDGFWWDRLGEIVFGRGELPAGFTLDDGRSETRWPTATVGQKERFYRDMVAIFKGAAAGERSRLLCRLGSWAGDGAAGAELRTLARSSWVTVGAHTVSHCRLSALPAAAQKEEIARSKRELETWLGREITVFSYPYGRRGDYTGESVALCRESGFARAAANFAGQAHRWTDPYQIPRHLVRDWPVRLFAERLKGFWTR